MDSFEFFLIIGLGCVQQNSGNGTISNSIYPNLIKVIGFVLLLGPFVEMLGLNYITLGAKPAWFVWATGVALIGLGAFSARGAVSFGWVVFTLFLGGAAQLWLTEPLWFPAIQLRPKNLIDLCMFGLIGLQALTALWVLKRAGIGAAITRWLNDLGLIRITLFLLLSFGFSVSLQGFLPRGFYVSYGLHLIAASAMVALNLASVLALLRLAPPRVPLRGSHPIIPALLVLGASAFLAWYGFERLPHVEDEAAYLFQAQTYAHGALALPAPPETAQPGLAFYLIEIRDGLWFPTTPPGWPAVLTLGVLLGAPWLVNPVLGALSVLLAHGITRRLAGRMQADVLALLMATSPWFLGASASLMPHNTAIFLTLLSWWLLMLTPKTARATLLSAALAGLAMGWVFTTRQLEGVLIGTLTGLWLVWRWKQGGGAIRTLAYSAGAILSGSVYLIHNHLMTGNFLYPPLARYLDAQWKSGGNAYGFGPNIGPPGGWGDLDIALGHWPSEGLINTLHNLSALQLELFGWGVGSLALIFALILWGRLKAREYAMLAICVVIIGAMFLYWFSGGYYLGPRYWFSLLFPALLLSSSGYFVVSYRLRDRGLNADSPAYILLVLSLFGLLVFTPWRGVTKYHGYNRVTSDIRQDLEQGDFGNALVFYDIPENPASAFYLNDPRLPDDKPVFLMDLGPAVNAQAARAFPNRDIRYWPGP